MDEPEVDEGRVVRAARSSHACARDASPDRPGGGGRAEVRVEGPRGLGVQRDRLADATFSRLVALVHGDDKKPGELVAGPSTTGVSAAARRYVASASTSFPHSSCASPRTRGRSDRRGCCSRARDSVRDRVGTPVRIRAQDAPERRLGLAKASGRSTAPSRGEARRSAMAPVVEEAVLVEVRARASAACTSAEVSPPGIPVEDLDRLLDRRGIVVPLEVPERDDVVGLRRARGHGSRRAESRRPARAGACSAATSFSASSSSSRKCSAAGPSPRRRRSGRASPRGRARTRAGAARPSGARRAGRGGSRRCRAPTSPGRSP